MEEGIKRLGQKGARCYKANNFAEAEVCYQRLVDLLNRQDNDIVSRRSAYFNLATTYLRLKKWQQAKRTLETLIELQQHEPAPMPNQVQKTQQRLVQCEAEITGNKAKIYNRAVVFLNEKLNLAKGIHAEENSEVATAHYNLGVAYQAAGNDSAAQEHLYAA